MTKGNTMSETGSRLPHYSKYCQCSACGLYFKAPYAFDMHRVGSGRDRRCLDSMAMSERGMAVTPEGYWYKAHAENR